MDKEEKECQKQIDKLNNVCDRCGRPIVPIKTVDNSGKPVYWSGCFHGGLYGHFTNGVKLDIFLLARKLILDGASDTWMSKNDYKDTSDLKQSWIEYQTHYFSDILSRAEYLKNNKPRYTEEEFMNTF